MKKQIGILLAAALLAVLAGGCAMRTVDQMYRIPKRSQAYSHVQKAMDEAMEGLEYAAPNSGENQQSVQLADLDGDGVDEYLLFARARNKTPLVVLVFDTDEEGNCFLMSTIELNGSIFERVEYVNVDDAPGVELVVGSQVSDQLMGNLSVYSFLSGSAEKLMSTSYSKFVTCDLDQDSLSELLVIRPSETIEAGEASDLNALAFRYEYAEGSIERSMEVSLSSSSENVKRITAGKLQGGVPGIFISNIVDNNAIATDVLVMQGGKFVNLGSPEERAPALHNYYVYAGDIDGDGITELPHLTPMRPVTVQSTTDPQYMISWYSLDIRGGQHEKLYTFHDYAGSWYLDLNPKWAQRISAERSGNSYNFYLWAEDGVKVQSLFTLYILTGSNRDQEAMMEERFPLYRKEGVAYAVKLHQAAEGFGLTEQHMIDSFHLIQQAWKTGET